MSAGALPPRILVLSGGMIHLVHQLAVASRLLPERGGSMPIAILITGVLRKQPEGLAALHGDLERWLAVLRRRQPVRFGAIQLATHLDQLPPHPWEVAVVNNQWLVSQREVVDQLDIRQLVVCGDGLGVYYRCPRELRAIAPSLLGLPIREPGRSVRYVLSGRQPRWHRPPIPPEPVPELFRRQLFATLVDAFSERAGAEVGHCLRQANGQRPLWLCSVPNLAHQFPGQRMPPEVLRLWAEGLGRQGFDPRVDRLQLIDHPKAPANGSFGPLTEPWVAPPLRSSLPLEVLILLLQQADPRREIRVCGMTSALYAVRVLTEAQVSWLNLAPLWRTNPHYRRRPLEWVHRWLRQRRMALLTAQVGKSP
ncbi:MAG: hypothetical protein VKO39_01185 [Cyanobacteriota bacterium]|nr:hypothetical protein [Cyanobacteriota bacterium]